MDLSYEELNRRMNDILNKWHPGTRPGNTGEKGNTLEDLLEIKENNLRIPDFGEIEIKAKDDEGKGLITLLHKEPMPGAAVPKLLLSMGWRHQNAGKGYPSSEKSFRSTTWGNYYSVRGFSIGVKDNRIDFIYDPSRVNRSAKDATNVYLNYGEWADDIELRSNPNYHKVFPVYYHLDELISTMKTKLDHTMLALTKTRKSNNQTEYFYNEAFMMDDLIPDRIPFLIEKGSIAVDFDARTGHNHGTKIRIIKSEISQLFTNFIDFV